MVKCGHPIEELEAVVILDIGDAPISATFNERRCPFFSTYVEKGALVNNTEMLETHRHNTEIVLKEMPRGNELFGRFASMISPVKQSAQTMEAVKRVMKRLEKLVNLNIKTISH